MIIISHVVALSNNNVIGKDNDLPWNLKTDLKHFKDYTSNKIIVMGRKTFESIGRPLPNRINYVVSNTIEEIAGAKVFNSTEGAIEEAKYECSRSGQNEIVIIGGGFLFRDTLKKANRLVLSKVNCDIEGDVFYPDVDLSHWEKVSSDKFYKDTENDYDFTVEVFERI
tara:strand:- start:711 stop:1214 length:504 start_codon:yes stop_codon:yes gene_type:complete